MKCLTAIVSMFIFGVGLFTNAARASGDGAEADKAAILALDQAYSQTWKDGDETGLMALFTDDVVVIPHHGDPQIEGRAALKDFWFPKGGSKTIVPQFDHTPTGIFINGDVGVVHGRFSLAWIYEGERTTIPAGNYLTVAVRTRDGWRIKRLTWNDDPRRWEQTPAD